MDPINNKIIQNENVPLFSLYPWTNGVSLKMRIKNRGFLTTKLFHFFILLFHFVSNLFLYVNMYVESYKLMIDQIECKCNEK